MYPTQIAMIVVMIATFIGIVVFDIFMAVNGIKGDTFSEIFISAAQRSLLLPVVFGTIFGHLLWSTTRWEPPVWMTFGVLGVSALIWLGVDVHYWLRSPKGFEFARQYPIILFCVYLVVGHLFWPQRIGG